MTTLGTRANVKVKLSNGEIAEVYTNVVANGYCYKEERHPDGLGWYETCVDIDEDSIEVEDETEWEFSSLDEVRDEKYDNVFIQELINIKDTEEWS